MAQVSMPGNCKAKIVTGTVTLSDFNSVYGNTVGVVPKDFLIYKISHTKQHSIELPDGRLLVINHKTAY